MRFTRLEAENFMSYKSLEFDLQGRGLVLILGDNRDKQALSSNGSGKTAVVDAFTWALWGQTLRGAAHDDVVHRGVGRNCWVSVSWEDDGGAYYTVRRFRRHKDHENRLILEMDGLDLCEGQTVADTQKAVNDVLGLDFQAASQSLVLGQGAIMHFLDGTDAERKHVLDLILGLTSLEKCLETVRTLKKEVGQTLQSDEKEISLLQSQEKRTKDLLIDLRTQADSYVENKRRKIQGLQRKLLDIQDEKERALEHREDVVSQKKGELGKLERESTILSQTLESRDSLGVEAQELRDALSKLGAKLQYLNLQEKGCRETIESLRTLGGSTECPLCGKDLSEDEVSAQLVSREEYLKDLMEEGSDVQDDIAEIKISLKSVDEKIRGFSDVESRMNKIAREKHRLHAEITAAKDSEAELRQLGLRYRDVQNELAGVKTEVFQLDDQIDKQEAELSALSIKLKEVEARYESNQQELPYLQFWETAFSNRGLKSYILESVIPILEDRANYAAATMLGPEFTIKISSQSTTKSGESREILGIQVLNDRQDDILLGASAGERQRINICMALALQSLISSRSQKSCGISFFDEFGENLDREGRERFIDLLRAELENKDTLIVVSHNPELQSYFQNVVYVSMKDGVSTIGGENVRNN